MSRYIAAPRKLWWDGGEVAQSVSHPTVYDSEPVKTGIVDKYGTPIYRLPDKIGFLPQKKG